MATRKTAGRPSPYRFRDGAGGWVEIPHTGQSINEATKQARAQLEQRNQPTPAPAAPDPTQQGDLQHLRDEMAALQQWGASLTGALETRLVELEQRLAQPDTEARLALSESVSTNLHRSLALSEEIAAAQQQVATTAEQATQQAAQATAMVAAANAVQSQLIPDVARQINAWQERFNEQEARLIALAGQFNDAAATIAEARDIKADADSYLRTSLAAQFREHEAQLADRMSVAFYAMGLSQADLDLAMRRLADGGLSGPAPIVSELHLQTFAAYARARQDAEQRTNASSANSAGRLDAANTRNTPRWSPNRAR